MGSKIEWTDETWNPIVGCSWASEGCTGCYAARDSYGRLSSTRVYEGLAEMHEESGLPRFTGELRVLGPGNVWSGDRFDQPLRWRKPRRVFVNSMSDLFHPKVPDTATLRLFSIMAEASQHTFQILTKRPERMKTVVDWIGRKFADSDTDRDKPWPLPNVWLGTSIETQRWADRRVPKLLETQAAVRFLSVEPLLGAVDLSTIRHREEDAEWRTNVLTGEAWCDNSTSPSAYVDEIPRVDYVIVGGESGPRARPMHVGWVRDLRDQCVDAGVPFHFKQWGEWAPSEQCGVRNVRVSTHRFQYESTRFAPDGTIYRATEPDLYSYPGMESVLRVGRRNAGRELDGRTWDEQPELVSA